MKHPQIRDIADAAEVLTGSRIGWYAAFIGLALNSEFPVVLAHEVVKRRKRNPNVSPRTALIRLHLPQTGSLWVFTS
jgi:hypothetical protein